MGALKEIVAGGIVAGAGVALTIIGDIIFSTFGATDGPVVDYRVLIEMGSLGLIGLGGLIAAVGLLHGAVRLWKKHRGGTTDRPGPRGQPAEPRGRGPAREQEPGTRPDDQFSDRRERR